jgi:hypothetical protein
MKSLFHYTTINNLALILKSKSIRFGRLDSVNDPNEGISSDFNSLAQYLFVSSWTATREENFALWNMYTPKMRGVRIELELPIFNSYKINNIDNYLVPEEKFFDYESNLFIIPGFNEPYRINYSDADEIVNPKILTSIGLATSKLGHHKRTIWSFEEEYRYRLEIYPIDPTITSDFFTDKYQSLITKRVPPSVNHYFIQIAQQSFKKMVITSGPRIELGDFEIMESLINNYNPACDLVRSSLTTYIK